MENDTRIKLIEAATPLFAKKGFAAVTVRELANAAGVNVAAVSYHFGGKEELYHAVVEHQFAPIAEALQAMPALSPASGEERLAMYASRIAGVHRQRPYLVRFMHAELTNPTTAFEQVIKRHLPKVFAFLHQAFREGVAAGEFRPDLHPGFAVLALAGIMNFYFIAKPLAQAVLPVSGLTDDHYTEQVFKIFLNGVRRRENE